MTSAIFDGREMYMLNDMFRREFSLVPGVIRAVDAGDEERASIVADPVTALTTVLRQHHSGEDTLSGRISCKKLRTRSNR